MITLTDNQKLTQRMLLIAAVECFNFRQQRDQYFLRDNVLADLKNWLLYPGDSRAFAMQLRGVAYNDVDFYLRQFE